MMNILIIISNVALIFSVIALVLSIINMTKLNSTHQVQYMNGEDYSQLQESIKEDSYYDLDGEEITDPKKKEEIRVKKLKESFEEAYSQE